MGALEEKMDNANAFNITACIGHQQSDGGDALGDSYRMFDYGWLQVACCTQRATCGCYCAIFSRWLTSTRRTCRVMRCSCAGSSHRLLLSHPPLCATRHHTLLFLARLTLTHCVSCEIF